MTKKMGRPKSENPKDIKLSVRLTESEDELLMRLSTREGITKTELIRRAIKKLLQDLGE